MGKDFATLLSIARRNAQENPKMQARETMHAVGKYVDGLLDEVEEVKKELKENNEVHLVDELSDIAWDYAVMLALLEQRGLITRAEDVLEHAHEKYTERAPAFLEGSQDLWEQIKQKQKIELAQKHKEKYGN